MIDIINSYTNTLQQTLEGHDWCIVEHLGDVLLDAAKTGKQVLICGNGGSAGNAIHLANDYLYGIAPSGHSMKVEALSANAAVLTCLGNDIGYENIFSHQIKIKADADDVLIALSGSGNSPNIINAIDMGNSLQMQTFAILGFTGGKAKNIAQHAIHFSVDDMQISEDLQVIVGHMLMQYLNRELRAVNG